MLELGEFGDIQLLLKMKIYERTLFPCFVTTDFYCVLH